MKPREMGVLFSCQEILYENTAAARLAPILHWFTREWGSKSSPLPHLGALRHWKEMCGISDP